MTFLGCGRRLPRFAFGGGPVEVEAHVDRDQAQAQDESGPNSTCGETDDDQECCMSHGSESRLDSTRRALAEAGWGCLTATATTMVKWTQDGPGWRHRLTGGLGHANVAPNKCTGAEF
jgi:hypothetical protein